MASATKFSSNPLETITPNMRMLLSMGFSYFQVLEAHSVFGDDINNMLCYLLEVEAGGMFDDSIYRMKGKAAERQ
jgi:OTU domain-containing protein 5